MTREPSQDQPSTSVATSGLALSTVPGAQRYQAWAAFNQMIGDCFIVVDNDAATKPNIAYCTQEEHAVRIAAALNATELLEARIAALRVSFRMVREANLEIADDIEACLGGDSALGDAPTRKSEMAEPPAPVSGPTSSHE